MPKIYIGLGGKGKEKEKSTALSLKEASGSQDMLNSLQSDDSIPVSPVRKPTKPEQNIGLFKLSGNATPKHIDVVAVHGLQGDAYKTWEHANGSLWLRDFLPADVPEAYILTFGYDSTIAFSNSMARIEDKALEFLNHLVAWRCSTPSRPSRPIVFICHSLGGIVVKKALIFAHERNMNPQFRDILDNTKGIAFLGVPHRGSDSGWWASVAANILKCVSIGKSTNTAIVSDIKSGSATLTNISKQFVYRNRNLKIWTFYETEKMYGITVVDESSAYLGLVNEELYPVHANHITICKSPSATSHEYRTVGYVIAREIRQILAQTVLHGRANTSYCKVPNRRVPQFVGREDILKRIDNALFHGPSPRIAVLKGMGGQGKSQIALEYCGRKKDNLGSAIFWVNAATDVSTGRSFEAIYEQIKSLEDVQVDKQAKVGVVLQMLGSWTGQWLLVFDNYESPDVFPNIADFIPEKGLGAVLVTSRHADSARLASSNSDIYIELGGLDEPDAIFLLIRLSGLRDFDSGDAKEIVQRLGCHPLAITQAGIYINKRKLKLCDFMDHYNRRRIIILNDKPRVTQYMKQLGDAEDEISLNVFTTCELSFQQMQSQASETDCMAKLLNLFAFFDNSDISEQLFVDFIANKGLESESTELLTLLSAFTGTNGKWDSELYEDTLIGLRDLSLLQDYTKEADECSHSSLHPLIKDWIRLRMDKATARENTLMAVMLLNEMIENEWHDEHSEPSLIAELTILSHIVALGDNCKEFDIPPSDIPLNRKVFADETSAHSITAQYLWACIEFTTSDILS